MLKRTLQTCLALCVFLSVSSAHAALVFIAETDLASDRSTLDFESATAGAIAGNDNLFTDFGLSNVGITGTFSFGGDDLDTNTDGQALAVFNGGLAIVEPGDLIDDLEAAAGFIFELASSITQFGFLMVDEVNHQTQVQTFFNGVLLDTIDYDPVGNFPVAPVFFESSNAVDEIRIIADGAPVAWGLDNLVIADVQQVADPIPEPLSIALLGIGLAGLGLARTRKTILKAI